MSAPRKRISLSCRGLLAAALLSLAASSGTLARDGVRPVQLSGAEQKEIRELIRTGRIRPLRQVIRALRDRIKGEILDVELLPMGDGYFYRFKVLAPDNRVEELFVDASAPDVLTLPQIRERFPQAAGELEKRQPQAADPPPEPNPNFASLPDRVKVVMIELQKRVGDKIAGFDFRRLANSPIFAIDLRTEKGQAHRYFVNARSGEIRTPDEARDFIERRFPWLVDEFYPQAGRPK